MADGFTDIFDEILSGTFLAESEADYVENVVANLFVEISVADISGDDVLDEHV